jgi:hypothetical protein
VRAAVSALAAVIVWWIFAQVVALGVTPHTHFNVVTVCIIASLLFFIAVTLSRNAIRKWR